MPAHHPFVISLPRPLAPRSSLPTVLVGIRTGQSAKPMSVPCFSIPPPLSLSSPPPARPSCSRSPPAATPHLTPPLLPVDLLNTTPLQPAAATLARIPPPPPPPPTYLQHHHQLSRFARPHPATAPAAQQVVALAPQSRTRYLLQLSSAA